jgi:hypothetical protein
MSESGHQEQHLSDELPIDLDSDGELRIPLPVPSREPLFDSLTVPRSGSNYRVGRRSSLPRRHFLRQHRHQTLIRDNALPAAMSTFIIAGVLILLILALNGALEVNFINLLAALFAIGCGVVYFVRWLNRYSSKR